MAKQTLLEIVQGVLSDIDGDEVNSISDTVESLQIAYAVRQCYHNMVEEMDLPHDGDILTLEAFVSSTVPTRLRLPENTSRIDWIKYSTPGTPAIAADIDSVGSYILGQEESHTVSPNSSASINGVMTFSAPVPITINFTENSVDSTGINVIVTGTDVDGEILIDSTILVSEEEIGSFTTVEYFLTVTEIDFDSGVDEPDLTVTVGNGASVPLKIYYQLKYKEPKCFLDIINPRATQGVIVQGVSYPDDSNIVLPILNNVKPTYWTSFDDEYIWFDSWDSSVESTINASSTEVFGYTSPAFLLTDEFIPDLPANLFPYLFQQVKAQAFADFKQALNPKAEQKENRLRIRAQRNKWRQGRKKGKYENDYGMYPRSSQSNRVRF